MTTVNFYDKEQTDDLLTAKADASNVYTKSEIDAKEIGAPTDTASSTGSLWARIKNAVARIINLETADANNVKKTGTSTVTGTLEVPTTPPTPTSVVNSVYVNDATEGANNLMHKTGNEKASGIKLVPFMNRFPAASVDGGGYYELLKTTPNFKNIGGPTLEVLVTYDSNATNNLTRIIMHKTDIAIQTIAKSNVDMRSYFKWCIDSDGNYHLLYDKPASAKCNILSVKICNWGTMLDFNSYVTLSENVVIADISQYPTVYSASYETIYLNGVLIQ